MSDAALEVFPADSVEQVAFFDRLKQAIDQTPDKGNGERDRLADQAWAIARQTGDPEHHAQAHWCAGLATMYRAAQLALCHFATARAYFQASGQPCKEARVLIGYGGLLGQQGQLAEAEAALETSQQQLANWEDYKGWPALYLNLSDLRGRQGRYAEMQTYAQQAECKARALGQPGNMARALVNQGYAAFCLGQLATAEQVLQAARQIAQTSQFAHVAGVALVNLARLAEGRNELFAALNLLQEAHECFTQADVGLEHATATAEEAALYERLHMPSEARRCATEAAAAYAQAGFTVDSLQARLIAVRLALTAECSPGKAYAQLAQAQALAATLDPKWQALVQGYAAHPLLHPTLPQLRQALTQVEDALASLAALGALPADYLEIALIAAQLATAIGQPEAANRYINLAQAAHAHHCRRVEIQALLGLANHVGAGAACELLSRAMGCLTEARAQMPAAELKANLVGGSALIYGQLIPLQLKRQQAVAALQTLLEAKGGLWLDLLTPPSLPAPVNAARLQAKVELSLWLQRAAETQTPAYLELCQRNIQKAEADLVAADRRVGIRRVPCPVPIPAEVLAQLPVVGAVVEYLVTPTRVLACVLRHGQPPHWVRLGRRAGLEELLRRLDVLLSSLRNSAAVAERRAAAHAQQATCDQILEALHTQLLAPLRPYLPPAGPLYVVPHDFLFAVPWAALRAAGVYLGDQYCLSLLPTAALVVATEAPGLPVAPPLVLGYAGQGTGHLLQHQVAELAAIQQVLPHARCIAPAHLSDLKWETPPALLHLSMHGVVRRQTPLLSRLEFANNEFLLLAEAFDLPLHGTGLVTLAACETGVAPEQGGAALALAGAFLCAGARAVVASGWQVDDEATSGLMAAFYSGLQCQLPLPEALRQAQQWLRAVGYTHPYYWAAFQLLQRSVNNSYLTAGQSG